MLPKTNVSKYLGLATDLTNTSGRSASRAMPKARLTYCLQLHCKTETLGQHALLGAKGAEESKGHKILGTQKPCLPRHDFN